MNARRWRKRVGLKNHYDLRTTSEVKAKPDQMPLGVKWHLLNGWADHRHSVPKYWKDKDLN